MARDPLYLNLGCGFAKITEPGWVNVDAYPVCEPDVVHDLDVTPLPWSDNSVDLIFAAHVFEHLRDWWPTFVDCARILRPGGQFEIRVPDESSSTALGWRDHRHIFTKNNFHGTLGTAQGTNAWAVTEKDTVPLRMVEFAQVPHRPYNWMIRFPRLMRFCANHGRNFIHEQRFTFVKVGETR